MDNRQKRTTGAIAAGAGALLGSMMSYSLSPSDNLIVRAITASVIAAVIAAIIYYLLHHYWKSQKPTKNNN